MPTPLQRAISQAQIPKRNSARNLAYMHSSARQLWAIRGDRNMADTAKEHEETYHSVRKYRDRFRFDMKVKPVFTFSDDLVSHCQTLSMAPHSTCTATAWYSNLLHQSTTKRRVQCTGACAAAMHDWLWPALWVLMTACRA